MAQLIKESACNEGDLGSVPAMGRSPGEGKGYPFQYSGLENSMDCIVHGVSKSWMQLSYYTCLPAWWLIISKESSSNAGDMGSVPWSGINPEERHGNPLQYSCLKNPTDRGTWWAIVHGAAKELDLTERLNTNTHTRTHTHTHIHNMAELKKHYAKWKESGMKRHIHIIRFQLYEMYRMGNSRRQKVV